MASFSADSAASASVPVIKLRGTENYESWKRNIRALLLGQGLWRHSSGLVPLPITQAQKDWETEVSKAKTPAEAPPKPTTWEETPAESQAIETWNVKD